MSSNAAVRLSVAGARPAACVILDTCVVSRFERPLWHPRLDRVQCETVVLLKRPSDAVDRQARNQATTTNFVRPEVLRHVNAAAY